MCENNGIGKNNALPWHISDDLRHFKTLTMGHTVIMGRRTFEAIGRPLPGRKNIIVTSRDPVTFESFQQPHDIAFLSLEQVMEDVKCDKMTTDNVFVIGGSQLYRHFLENGLVDRIYMTRVLKEFVCDTYFPVDAMAKQGFEVVKCIDHTYSLKERCDVLFEILEKNKNVYME